MARNNYDRIARQYDFVSRIIFGKRLIQAQESLLHRIKNGDKILLVGGGNGKILESIAALKRTNVAIIFVDASKEMIRLARQKKHDGLQVAFIAERIENIAFEQQFDIVFTPFFLDNFAKEKVAFLFAKIHSYLKPSGLWLYVDFEQDTQNKKLWKSILLKTMYLFFKITCDIETTRLVDPRYLFDQNNYHLRYEGYSFCHFIVARCFQKA